MNSIMKSNMVSKTFNTNVIIIEEILSIKKTKISEAFRQGNFIMFKVEIDFSQKPKRFFPNKLTIKNIVVFVPVIFDKKNYYEQFEINGCDVTQYSEGINIFVSVKAKKIEMVEVEE